jgi:hypothetical protein
MVTRRVLLGPHAPPRPLTRRPASGEVTRVGEGGDLSVVEVVVLEEGGDAAGLGCKTCVSDLSARHLEPRSDDLELRRSLSVRKPDAPRSGDHRLSPFPGDEVDALPRKHGHQVSCNPAVGAREFGAVAELTIALMLMAARRLTTVIDGGRAGGISVAVALGPRGLSLGRYPSSRGWSCSARLRASVDHLVVEPVIPTCVERVSGSLSNFRVGRMYSTAVNSSGSNESIRHVVATKNR